MKIRTVKKLNLHELIEYVWENEVFDMNTRLAKVAGENTKNFSTTE